VYGSHYKIYDPAGVLYSTDLSAEEGQCYSKPFECAVSNSLLPTLIAFQEQYAIVLNIGNVILERLLSILNNYVYFIFKKHFFSL